MASRPQSHAIRAAALQFAGAFAAGLALRSVLALNHTAPENP